MSLLDAFNAVKEEKFDPNKGEVGDSNLIPEGTYNVSLDAVTHGVWDKSQTDYVRFTLKVLDGEQAGRNENITPTLAETTSKGKEMPQFVLERSVKIIRVIGAMVGLEVSPKCFTGETESDDYEQIQNEFRPYLGKTLVMSVRNRPNKNNPDRPNRDYKFEKMEQPKKLEIGDPFEGQKTPDTEGKKDDGFPF